MEPPQSKEKNEFLYFALRNNKLVIGLIVVFFFLVFAIIGPFLTEHGLNERAGPRNQPPSAEYWFGTTTFGQDVFTQFVYGLRAAFIVGFVGGGLATIVGMLVGFFAGYHGGMVDELLNMLTNTVITIPKLAVLLVIAAYLTVRGVIHESIVIGLWSWPWAARAVRSQTFSLKSRNFVDMARMTGMSSPKIILTEIAPNMMSYLFMTFVLQFGGAVLAAATLDFIGLGPTEGISLGLMMQHSFNWSAIQLGIWWWFVPPGAALALLVGAMYLMNVGLDEVFNPKLRER